MTSILRDLSVDSQANGTIVDILVELIRIVVNLGCKRNAEYPNIKDLSYVKRLGGRELDETTRSLR